MIITSSSSGCWEVRMFRRTLQLTPERRAELEQVRDRNRRPYLRECAAALLKVAEGQSAHQVALTGLHKPRAPDTLYRWLNKYQQEGLAGVVHPPPGDRGFSPRGGEKKVGGGPQAPP